MSWQWERKRIGKRARIASLRYWWESFKCYWSVCFQRSAYTRGERDCGTFSMPSEVIQGWQFFINTPLFSIVLAYKFPAATSRRLWSGIQIHLVPAHWHLYGYGDEFMYRWQLSNVSYIDLMDIWKSSFAYPVILQERK